MVGGRSQSQLSVPLCRRPAWEWVQTPFLEWGWGAGLGRWVSGGLRQGPSGRPLGQSYLPAFLRVFHSDLSVRTC